MRKTLGLLALAVILGAATSAQAASGPAALQYYVGTWSCQAGPVGQAPAKATVTYALDGSLLRQSVEIPAQGKMTKPSAISIATSYDAKAGRFVQTGMDTSGSWWVSSAQPWSGNTEQWTDHANSDNRLGRSQVVRTNQNSFTFTDYPSLTGTKPVFKGTCTRS